MPLESVPAVRYGMAGIIDAGRRGIGPDGEAWLHRAFRSAPDASRVEWRSDDMVVVTQQHALETHAVPGTFKAPMPAAGGLEGLVVGHFFGAGSAALDLAQISQRAVEAHRRDDAASFQRLNGGWVAALWDRNSRQAHFVRDPVGSQPLYAMRWQAFVVFATDLRIFEAAGTLGPLDDQALAEFLHFLYVPPPRTMAKDCYAVHAGHVLTIGADIRHTKYAAPRFVTTASLNAADVDAEVEARLPEFEERLLNAVADSLPRTGRVAFGLSGGQDSSTLAIALSKLCPDRALAFTVGERDERLTEIPHAALVCKTLGLQHHTYVPTDRDIARGLDSFVRLQDQPIGDVAALAYYLGMLQLPADCGVILDGAGNDDYFGLIGHGLRTKYVLRAKVQRYIPDALWPAFMSMLALGPAGLKNLNKLWERPLEDSFVAWYGWSEPELSALYGRDVSFATTFLWQVMRRHKNPEDWRPLMTDVIGGIWEAQAGIPKGVHFAHALGKGMRFPFIDERLAGFVHQLPMELKLDKRILLAYMKKNLPKEIVDKPKSGFIFDLNRVFFNPEHRWAEELRRAGQLKVLPSWSDAEIDGLLARHAADPGNLKWQHRLYALSLAAAVIAQRQEAPLSAAGAR